MSGKGSLVEIQSLWTIQDIWRFALESDNEVIYNYLASKPNGNS